MISGTVHYSLVVIHGNLWKPLCRNKIARFSLLDVHGELSLSAIKCVAKSVCDGDQPLVWHGVRWSLLAGSSLAR
jgi:hypothetical protein